MSRHSASSMHTLMCQGCCSVQLEQYSAMMPAADRPRSPTCPTGYSSDSFSMDKLAFANASRSSSMRRLSFNLARLINEHWLVSPIANSGCFRRTAAHAAYSRSGFERSEEHMSELQSLRHLV